MLRTFDRCESKNAPQSLCWQFYGIVMMRRRDRTRPVWFVTATVESGCSKKDYGNLKLAPTPNSVLWKTWKGEELKPRLIFKFWIDNKRRRYIINKPLSVREGSLVWVHGNFSSRDGDGNENSTKQNVLMRTVFCGEPQHKAMNFRFSSWNSVNAEFRPETFRLNYINWTSLDLRGYYFDYF